MISKTKRLDYLDLLKGLTVLLIVLHHAGQPYGNGGSWPVIEDLKIPWLDSFLAVNAAFFMGLLFFISGYVMPRTMERDGPGLFLKKKVIRLGIPVLFIAVFFFGPINWFMGPSFTSFRAYLVWAFTLGLHDMTGHLWFIIHLLIYSVLFTGVVALLTSMGIPVQVVDDQKSLKSGLLVAIGFLVGGMIMITVLLVREAIPRNRWVNLLGFIPSEPAHLPQYAILFLTGVIAGYYRILERVPSWSGYLFLGIGITAALYRYLQPAFSAANYPIYFLGGETDQVMMFWAIIETLIAIGFTFGFPVLFRELGRFRELKAPLITRNSYGLYLLHVFLLVPIQLALEPVDMPLEMKFLGSAALGIALTLSIIIPLTRVSGLKRIL